MAATTITREAMTDGVTSWSVVRISSAIYDRIDALLANALTLGGVLTVEAFGTSQFSSGGTGGNTLGVRNTTAGTANYGRLQVGNDSSASLLTLTAYSSTFTGASSYSIIDATGSPGINLRASHASGVVRIDSGGLTTQMSVAADGQITITKNHIYTPGTPGINSNMTVTHVNNGVMFLTPIGGPYDVQGLTAGTSGQVAYLINVGSSTMTLTHENASATAANRFVLPSGTDVALAQYEGVTLVYNGTASRWVKLK